MKNPHFKTIAYAMPTANIKALAKDLKNGGYDVTYSSSEGKMLAQMDGVDVARAFKMGRAWCLRADTRVVTPTN